MKNIFITSLWHIDKKKIILLVSMQRIIYIPVPTWGNHPKIFTFGGLSVKTYRYYDPRTRGLDYQG